MKDVESGAMKAGDGDGHVRARNPREAFAAVRRSFTPKQVLAYIGIAVIMVGAVFGIGLVASSCGAFPSPAPAE